jgi:hypothetical protein
VAVIVGKGFIVTVTVLVSVHPEVFSPERVYVVVTDGVTEILFPVMLPGFQV